MTDGKLPGTLYALVAMAWIFMLLPFSLDILHLSGVLGLQNRPDVGEFSWLPYLWLALIPADSARRGNRRGALRFSQFVLCVAVLMGALDTFLRHGALPGLRSGLL